MDWQDEARRRGTDYEQREIEWKDWVREQRAIANRERQHDAEANMRLRVELRDAYKAEEMQMERALAMSRISGLPIGASLQARRARMRACSHSYTPPPMTNATESSCSQSHSPLH